MGFYDILDQILDLLRRRGRVTYRALKREFDLDDAFIEDLKDELLYARGRRATDHRDVLRSGRLDPEDWEVVRAYQETCAEFCLAASCCWQRRRAAGQRGENAF